MSGTHSSGRNKKFRRRTDLRSRKYKLQRSRYCSAANKQPTVTEHLKFLNEIQILCAANKDLKETIALLLNDNPIASNSSNDENYSFVLKSLFRSAAQQHSAKHKSRYRYANSMKDFAAYIFMLGGRLCYETLHKNIPIPSPTSVGRYLHDNGPEMIEGVLRCSQLKQYLTDRNLPMTVWVSEDGTRITGRLQYDPGTNQIVGLVLPLESNGMPKSKTFLATSPRTMQEHVDNNKVSSTVSFLKPQF